MNINERVAFIKGLVKGLDFDESTCESKVILSMIELLDELSKIVTDLEEENRQLWETIGDIDDDLAELEDEVYSENSCDCEDCDCDDCDCDCDEDCDCDDFDYEVTCPICNEVICLTDDLIEKKSINCPKCGETLEFDLDDIIEEEEEES